LPDQREARRANLSEPLLNQLAALRLTILDAQRTTARIAIDQKNNASMRVTIATAAASCGFTFTVSTNL
jgi:hypothetical protein